MSLIYFLDMENEWVVFWVKRVYAFQNKTKYENFLKVKSRQRLNQHVLSFLWL